MRSLKCALICLSCVVLLSVIEGCGSGLSGNPGTSNSGSGGSSNSGARNSGCSSGAVTGIQAGGLFVLSNEGAGILEFSDNATGVASPIATVNAPTSIPLSNSFEGLAVDGCGNVYVGYFPPGNTSDIEILEYALGASG